MTTSKITATVEHGGATLRVNGPGWHVTGTPADLHVHLPDVVGLIEELVDHLTGEDRAHVAAYCVRGDQ